MILSNHGASTLGKSLRRPIMTTINYSFDGTTTLASDAMRSTFAAVRGKGSSSSITRSIYSNTTKTWHPNHGIVFKDDSGSSTPRRLSTLASADQVQDLTFNSHLEGSYVLKEAHFKKSDSIELSAVDAKEATVSVDEPTTEEVIDEISEDPKKNELPISASSYKMTEELFRKAKDADLEAPESYWSYNLYRGPEENGVPRKVKVHYCRTKHTTERTLQQYFLDKKLVGFDIEWKMEARATDGPKKNVSLIQLATEERIALFHIALFPKDDPADLVAPTLKKIMEDPEITKVGVCIRGDCTRLKKHLDINSVSLFELSHLHRLVKYSESKEYKLINKRVVSLATQVEEHLHLPMFKGDVRISDWSQELKIDQIAYAASDSYAGIHLYDVLENKRQALDPTPPQPYHADENKPIRLADNNILVAAEDETEETEPGTELEAEETSPKKRKYTRRKQNIPDPLPLDPDVSLLEPDSDSINPTKPSTSSKSDQSPVILSAEVLASIYRSEHPATKLSIAPLRSYFIWQHNPTLSLSEIAALLRDTPLQVSTVAKYILDAVRLESLSYEKDRLKDVLQALPRDVVWTRYRGLAKIVDLEKA